MGEVFEDRRLLTIAVLLMWRH